ncbi:hypothetical protein DFH08DRAFT_802684 [Mycena albidolilacea]|uniref:Uncharacterized protein n=1 Tax=Mycena albidolilacea TaxID=1033008 RepID=A0AAD7AEK2_9AGAR|nr:hypothetical protein DFH08DRAFT_802684 [Mycena albidolilacea]
MAKQRLQHLNLREINIEVEDKSSGSWVKTTRSKVDLTLLWKVYSSTQDDVVKKKASSGPNSSMYLSACRPVFVPNVSTVYEGRLLEYEDIYGLLPRLDDPDLHYNRVPEVLIYNSVTKKYLPMSFHELHRLGPGLVVNITVVPMAFTWGRAHQKQELGWEYHLMNITVLGCQEDDALSSPSKLVVKRKIVALDLDSSSDERDPKKTASTAKAGSATQSGAQGSGGGEHPK